ncbi:MBL fold metallo-hydrolase [Leptolyngbya sp. BL0902]|uniref:MBL fold metallo-hydrolase n=1 Tax=Leptolyngbya sp. BL0902 TaxID=1115757 RepID=UPI0018E799A5|nr:MBL fold metallo-hydrolase [Leptolyngbya sp. BL0902]QQE66570.1 MBL fold metallo-hydrolase [Leptolyngbya sp. BL0902]
MSYAVPSGSHSSRDAVPDHPPSQFLVRFWGVRGNIPTPGPDTVRYGGNTACVEVQVADQRLIFDGGTGLRSLGLQLAQQDRPVEAHLFFTHTHWDRIQGFPFFHPAFDADSHLHIYGATALNGASIKQRLTEQMLRPNFFKPLQAMTADLAFHTIQPGSHLKIGDVSIDTVSLNPHTAALGYRVTWQGKSMVYASDTDPDAAVADPNLLFLAAAADLLIFDGTYLDMAYADLQSHHQAPWEMGVEIAKASGVKRLLLFHHNPCHSDSYLAQLEGHIQAAFPQAALAQEGMIIDLLQGGSPQPTDPG